MAVYESLIRWRRERRGSPSHPAQAYLDGVRPVVDDLASGRLTWSREEILRASCEPAGASASWSVEPGPG